jgi:hypothetical protein
MQKLWAPAAQQRMLLLDPSVGQLQLRLGGSTGPRRTSPELGFSVLHPYLDILAFKRAEDDKLMKFHRAAEFMRVPPDLITATLYKYMVLRLLFLLHSWQFYVQTKSNTARWQLCMCSGNRREAALWRERPGYPWNCVRFRHGIEWGYTEVKNTQFTEPPCTNTVLLIARGKHWNKDKVGQCRPGYSESIYTG